MKIKIIFLSLCVLFLNSVSYATEGNGWSEKAKKGVSSANGFAKEWGGFAGTRTAKGLNGFAGKDDYFSGDKFKRGGEAAGLVALCGCIGSVVCGIIGCCKWGCKKCCGD